MTDRNKVTLETKEAWINNWKDHSIEKVLSIFEYPRVRRLLDIFVSILPEGGKIIEGGCGLGPWVIKLRSLGYDVTGVDYDEASIEKIRSYDNSIPLYVSNIEDMPFSESCFDAYMSLGVLEHFCEGPHKAIGEAVRVLKPGGLFVVMLPYLNILERIKLPSKKLQRNKKIRKLMGKEDKEFYYEKYFSIKEISSLLEDCGFSIENVRPIDHIFTFVSFSGIFRDKNTYDGENDLAVKCADLFSRIMPWQTAGSSLIVAKNMKGIK